MGEPLTDAERARRYRRRHPERIKAAAARRNALRIWCGQFYAGYVTRKSTARTLNDVIRKEHDDR